MSVVLDAYRPGLDDDEVLDLRARVWGADHGHTSAAFFGWLFGRNPAGAASGVLLRRGGVLIGFAGLSPRIGFRNGQRIRIAHGLDFMVDPNAARGLAGAYALKVADRWARLAKEQGYAFGVNFPNANSYRLLTSRRLGWQRVLAPRLLLRPLPGLRLREGLPRWISPTAAAFGGTVLAHALALRAKLGTAPGPCAGTPARAVADFDWLPAEMPAVKGLSFGRDRSYLTWRYRDHPVYRYTILARSEPGRGVSGLVVTPRTLFGVESALVVDLVGDGHVEAVVPLITRAVADAAAEGARIVGGLACAGSPLDWALRRCGFLPVPAAVNPKPFYMVGLPLAAQEAAFADGPWQFAWGDMDVV